MFGRRTNSFVSEFLGRESHHDGIDVRSRVRTLADVARQLWSGTPKVITLRLNAARRVSFRCWFLGHEDWVRRAPGRLYLECFECGRKTPGWTTESQIQKHLEIMGRIRRHHEGPRLNGQEVVLAHDPDNALVIDQHPSPAQLGGDPASRSAVDARPRSPESWTARPYPLGSVHGPAETDKIRRD